MYRNDAQRPAAGVSSEEDARREEGGGGGSRALRVAPSGERKMVLLGSGSNLQTILSHDVVDSAPSSPILAGLRQSLGSPDTDNDLGSPGGPFLVTAEEQWANNLGDEPVFSPPPARQLEQPTAAAWREGGEEDLAVEAAAAAKLAALAAAADDPAAMLRLLQEKPDAEAGSAQAADPAAAAGEQQELLRDIRKSADSVFTQVKTMHMCSSN